MQPNIIPTHFARLARIITVAAVMLTCIVSTQVNAAEETGFIESECPFDIPSGWTEGKNLICGFVVVPQDHAKPDGDTLKIAVAILKTRNPKPQPDPIFYLEGGPGGYLLNTVDFFSESFAPLLRDRDVILFDQRGVGFSEPALNCPNLIDYYYVRLVEDKSDDIELAATVKEGEKCRQELAKQGINFSVYNTLQNAADVEAIRKALDYETVNLYGISYGTRLGLTVMRDFPDSVRSAVLDSVVPLESDFTAEYPLYLDRAFKALFTACAENPLCNKTYPDLEKVFYQTVDKLNTKPEIVPAKQPRTGEDYDVVLDGDLMISTLFRSMYVGQFVPGLPALIYEVKDGKYDEYIRQHMLLLAYSEDFSTGMYYSVNCFEEVPFFSEEKYKGLLQKLPKQIQEYGDDNTDWDLDMCKMWNIGSSAEPTEDQPVKSDIPALVVSGQYDPITPPEYAKQVADNLSNSYYYNVINGGHGPTLDSTCMFNIVRGFINNPTEKPNDRCLQSFQSPLFTVPLTALETDMVAFKNAKLGISGLAPEGWVETEDGVYSALGKSNLSIRLVYRVRDDGVKGYLDFFMETNGLKFMPDPTDTLEANGLEWTMYKITADETTFDLATTEIDGTGYIVVLLSPSTPARARDTLFEDVFMEAVEALEID